MTPFAASPSQNTGPRNRKRQTRTILEPAKTLLTAAWIAPMDAPLVRDGAIIFDQGRITAMGSAKMLRHAHSDASIHDLGGSIILPGLVNAHTHLELSGCTAGNSPASFTDWIGSMPRRVGLSCDFAATARAGADQSIQFGVTTVGDISQQSHLTRPVLRADPLRVISFGEVLGIGKTRWKVQPLIERAFDPTAASNGLTVGVSPHAPYSLDSSNFAHVSRIAMDQRLPLTTHLAELPYEREFLQHHTGPMREFLERMGIWQDDIETFAGGPIELAKTVGLLDYPALLAHVNYCNEDELTTLANGQASIVYCPRTHIYFGHPPHRWLDMLARGINVAVGTDSCASSPDLNLVNDLRLLHRLAPQVPPQQLWEMATTRAARALRMEAEIGSLAIGKCADAAVFSVQSEDPLQEILESDIAPRQVWIAGMQRKWEDS